MKKEQLERITFLTNLFISRTITKEEQSELDVLQEEWLLNSSIAQPNDDTLKRSFKNKVKSSLL